MARNLANSRLWYLNSKSTAPFIEFQMFSFLIVNISLGELSCYSPIFRISLCVFFFRLFSSSCSRPGFDFQFSAVVRGEIHLKKKKWTEQLYALTNEKREKKEFSSAHNTLRDFKAGLIAPSAVQLHHILTHTANQTTLHTIV